MDITGPVDGLPTRVGIAVTDYLAGLYALAGILLALWDRQRTGLGQLVDIALFDSLMSTMTLPVGILFATGSVPHRMGNEHPSVAPYETFSACDGLIVVAVGNPRLWTQFCKALNIDGLADNPRFRTNSDRLEHREALRQGIETVFKPCTVSELLDKLQTHHVPCGRVRSVADAVGDPQLQARDMLIDIAPAGLKTITGLGNPIKLSRSPYTITLPPPRLGEHTDDLDNAAFVVAGHLKQPTTGIDVLSILGGAKILWQVGGRNDNVTADDDRATRG